MNQAAYTPAPWTTPGWEEYLAFWCDDELARHAIARNGALNEVRIRPWSALWRVPTNQGVFWLKACAPAMKHEAALIDILSRLRPDVLPPIYGIDMYHGLILMADGGDLLRPFTRNLRETDHWLRIFPVYAALQQALIHHSTELLAAGVIDRRLETLPSLYDDLLADEAALAIGAPHGLAPADHAHLIALSPTFVIRCSELSALGIPATIDHSDFHDGNILLQDGRYRFIDWGDACVTHPFLTILVALRSIAYGLDLEPEDPLIRQLRTLYLAQWIHYGALDELQRAMAVAERLTMVNRALTWRSALTTVSSDEAGEYADAVPGWLQAYLQAETAAA